MYAIKSNSCYVLQQLVASENNTFTADGVTPLMISASVNNVPALTALIPLQSGKTDTRGRTALMYGAMKGSVEATELMVQGTQELGAQDTMGFTSLMYAAVNNAIALLPTLLSGERCKRDREGKTALMHAAIAGNAECVKLLLLSETGAIDNDDYTALMRAVEKGHREVVDLLLEAEGDTHHTWDSSDDSCRGRRSVLRASPNSARGEDAKEVWRVCVHACPPSK